ncbi:MAG: DUF4304 domain-containing protein [Minicystis sp.]
MSMDELHQILSLLRFGHLRAVTRQGATARLTVAPPDGGAPIVVVLEGCADLTLHPSEEGAAAIADPAELGALDLEITNVQIVPEPVVLVIAWRRGAPVRGGRLRVRAAGVRLEDASGAPLSRQTLVDRASAATRARMQRFSAADYRRALDAVLKKDVRPTLNSAGFTPDKRTFIRARDGLVDMITFEIGRFASAESMSFTVRLDVLVGTAGGARPTQTTVLGNARPALHRELEPPYVLAGTVDTAALAGRLEDDVKRIALPFFDRFRSPDDVVNALVDEDRRNGGHRNAYTVAEILARLGRLAEARPHFLRAEGDRDAIRRVAASYGITLDPEISKQPSSRSIPERCADSESRRAESPRRAFVVLRNGTPTSALGAGMGRGQARAPVVAECVKGSASSGSTRDRGRPLPRCWRVRPRPRGTVSCPIPRSSSSIGQAPATTRRCTRCSR